MAGSDVCQLTDPSTSQVPVLPISGDGDFLRFQRQSSGSSLIVAFARASGGSCMGQKTPFGSPGGVNKKTIRPGHP